MCRSHLSKYRGRPMCLPVVSMCYFCRWSNDFFAPPERVIIHKIARRADTWVRPYTISPDRFIPIDGIPCQFPAVFRQHRIAFGATRFDFLHRTTHANPHSPRRNPAFVQQDSRSVLRLCPVISKSSRLLGTLIS